jgi:hypothetical protein
MAEGFFSLFRFGGGTVAVPPEPPAIVIQRTLRQPIQTVVPLAKEKYERREEQGFRDYVRRNLDRAINTATEGILHYPGIPIVMVSGTDTAWLAPTGGTPTKVAFDTVVAETADHTFSTTDNAFTIAFAGAYRIYFHLFHNGGGAVKKVDIATCAFKNGVETSRNTVQRELDQVWNTEGTFVTALVAGDVLDLRIQHTETVDVSFDLTYSRIMLEQLTARPY